EIGAIAETLAQRSRLRSRFRFAPPDVPPGDLSQGLHEVGTALWGHKVRLCTLARIGDEDVPLLMVRDAALPKLVELAKAAGFRLQGYGSCPKPTQPRPRLLDIVTIELPEGIFEGMRCFIATWAVFGYRSGTTYWFDLRKPSEKPIEQKGIL